MCHTSLNSSCVYLILLQEAIALLDPMTNDPVNFVRQGALIASAMILIQQTEHTCPKVRFRASYFNCNASHLNLVRTLPLLTFQNYCLPKHTKQTPWSESASEL
jgi:hypothetical protein